MTAVAAMPRVVDFDPLLDKTYRHTALGPSVADFLVWLELGGTRPRTLDQYERDLARGCLLYPSKGLGEFGDEEMIHVARAFKPKERRVRVAAYRSFFKWALRRRLIVSNPCDVLPVMKRQPKKVYDTFTAAEIQALCSLPLRDGALFTVMFGAGPRKGDCRAFQIRHWRPDATPEAPYGSLAFLGGKGGKDRLVPATAEIARALAELQTLEGLGRNDFVWYTRPGGGQKIDRAKPIGDGSFDRWWGRSLDAAGVRYRNPHLTRHTFATNFLRGRGRLETLRIVLGHESIATTSDLYGHLDTRDVAFDMGLVGITPE